MFRSQGLTFLCPFNLQNTFKLWIVINVAWLLIFFVVIHLPTLVLFPCGSSSILVVLNVIPSINPSSLTLPGAHTDLWLSIMRLAVCAEQWSRQVITRRANQGLMKRENVPSPKHRSDSQTLVADLQAHVEQTNTDQGLLHRCCPLKPNIQWLSSLVTEGLTYLPSISHSSSLHFISLSVPTWM